MCIFKTRWDETRHGLNIQWVIECYRPGSWLLFIHKRQLIGSWLTLVLWTRSSVISISVWMSPRPSKFMQANCLLENSWQVSCLEFFSHGVSDKLSTSLTVSSLVTHTELRTWVRLEIPISSNTAAGYFQVWWPWSTCLWRRARCTILTFTAKFLQKKCFVIFFLRLKIFLDYNDVVRHPHDHFWLTPEWMDHIFL